MNETKISYKCNVEDDKVAGIEYSKKFGILSKKTTLKMIFIPLAVVISACIALLIFTDEVLAIVSVLISALVVIPLMLVVMRYSNKKIITRNSELVYSFDFNNKSASEICLDDEFITITKAYSKTRIPFNEVESVISNRMYFIIKYSGNEVLTAVPKRGQNADTLFAMDNIFKNKLGEKFIYDM